VPDVAQSQARPQTAGIRPATIIKLNEIRMEAFIGIQPFVIINPRANTPGEHGTILC